MISQEEITQQYCKQIRKVLAGQISDGQAREAMRRFLVRAGYTPAPEEEDTIKDLTSYERGEVMIGLSVDLARGQRIRREVFHDEFHPAWEFFRVIKSRNPLDWESYWYDVATEIDWQGVSRSGEMIALVSSPIWNRLSAFSLPYPPFAYNSGMRVRSVDFGRCVQLGLLRDEDFGYTAASDIEARGGEPKLQIEDFVEMISRILDRQGE